MDHSHLAALASLPNELGNLINLTELGVADNRLTVRPTTYCLSVVFRAFCVEEALDI